LWKRPWRRPRSVLPMRIVVDTNFVVALVVEDDINHEDAVEKFQVLEKAYLPAIVVAELAYFIYKT